MGVRNYLVDGGSGTGKTTVCNELNRRGYQAIHGDRELKSPPEMGNAKKGLVPGYDLPPNWDMTKVNALIANQDEPITFFCGGCSNTSEFIDRLDGVFVLKVDDINTIMKRLDERVLVDPTDWGGKPEEREITRRLHENKDAITSGQAIDATASLQDVVEEILHHINL